MLVFAETVSVLFPLLSYELTGNLLIEEKRIYITIVKCLKRVFFYLLNNTNLALIAGLLCGIKFDILMFTFDYFSILVELH